MFYAPLQQVLDYIFFSHASGAQDGCSAGRMVRQLSPEAGCPWGRKQDGHGSPETQVPFRLNLNDSDPLTFHNMTEYLQPQMDFVLCAK